MRCTYLCAAAVAVGAAASAFASQGVWGYFDESRLNYSGAPLNASAHTVLAGMINASGQSLAAPTPTLTAGYLGGVDVFYTSLFRLDGGSLLSAAEQTALQNWFNSGGTLIVTADIWGHAAYDSVTSFLGVTNYSALGNVGAATTINAHFLTAGVTSVDFNTEATFTIPGNALALMNGPTNQLFGAVMDPATGFGGPGRLFIVGDHNMFTNGIIGQADNTQLAQNMIDWVKIPAPGTAAGLLMLAGAGAARRRR